MILYRWFSEHSSHNQSQFMQSAEIIVQSLNYVYICDGCKMF